MAKARKAKSVDQNVERKIHRKSVSRSTKVGAKRVAKRRPKSVPRSTKVGAKHIAKGRRINARLKGITLALEPPVDGDRAKLDSTFRVKLQAALAQLAAAGSPFKLVEGYRTTDRQQWLYGSGRPGATPYGRAGPVLTNADGVNHKSKHQGNGTTGSGLAVDCYPTRNGQVYIPPSTDQVWDAYAAAVEAQALVAGHHFTSIKDSPHCEMP